MIINGNSEGCRLHTNWTAEKRGASDVENGAGSRSKTARCICFGTSKRICDAKDAKDVFAGYPAACGAAGQ